MTRRAAGILVLMLSLPAAALLVAADGVGVDTIRLPSDGGEDKAVALGEKNVGGVLEKDERPWTCCNSTVCTKSMPPTCRCLDEVEECAPACKACEPSGFKLSFHVCKDQYHGDPGPACAKDDDVPAGSPSLAAPAAQMHLLIASMILLFTQSR